VYRDVSRRCVGRIAAVQTRVAVPSPLYQQGAKGHVPLLYDDGDPTPGGVVRDDLGEVVCVNYIVISQVYDTTPEFDL